VREIYLDRETGRPEWVLVDIDGEQARFVPLANASVESSTIRVAHSADAIRRAPGIGAEPRIDQTEERKLYDHYGIGYSEDESGSGLPADEPPREPDTTATTSDATEERPAAFVAPDPSDGGPDAPDTTDRSEPVTSSTGDDTPTSSWSAAADEPSNLAPAPADPPSAEELESADIRQPAAAEDFTATTEPEPTFQASATVPSGGGEILAAGTAADAETDLKTSLGPDTVNVFSPPSAGTRSASVWSSRQA